MPKAIAQAAQRLDEFGARTSDSVRAKKAAKWCSGFVWKLVRAVIMAGLAFILLYPLLYMVSMALRPRGEIFDPTVIWVPRQFTLENIVGAFELLQYPQSFLQTFLVCIISSFIQIFSCGLTGYGFARFHFRGRGVLFVFVLISIIIPPQTTMISQYVMNSKFDFFGILSLLNIFGANLKTPSILNTVWPFYLPALFGWGIRSGLLIFIYRQFFRGMPRELEDAAYIDGAGPLRTFVTVMAPNALSAVLTVFLFSTVWYWNDYFYSATFMSTSQTLSVRLASLPNYLVTQNFQADPYKYITQIQAGCLLCILPILAVYVIFQRYFTESIEKTGLVG